MVKKKPITIFFSWQSDSSEGNRKIITNALCRSCEKLKDDSKYTINVDTATRNVPGAPAIEMTIFDKIDKCDVFIADITPVALADTKQMPNSNVLIETGYALKVLDDKCIILVARRGDWRHEDLPFDINHRRVGIFTENNCNLEFEVKSSIEFCIKQRTTKAKIKKLLPSSRHVVLSQPNHEEQSEKDIVPLEFLQETTLTFFQRTVKAFHGKRETEEITNKKEIRRFLSTLLTQPLYYTGRIGGDKINTDPFWWFRSGSADAIRSFRLLKSGKVLLNNIELKIRRIIVGRNDSRYYANYVYVETNSDVPCGPDKAYYTREKIADLVKEIGYCHCEYAIYKPGRFLPSKLISLQDYDDGATSYFGRTVSVNSKAELRERYLSPFNFVICAKFAPYNCHAFDLKSEEVMVQMLDGSMSVDDFNKFMTSFPRNPREEF